MDNLVREIQQKEIIIKFTPVFIVILVMATPTFAFEIEEIGAIEASFDGGTISQPTVVARDGDEASPTAFLFLNGVTATLNIEGFSMDNARLSVDVEFMTEQPGPETAPLGVTVIYAPQGRPPQWTSEERPTEPRVTFTTLETDGEEAAPQAPSRPNCALLKTTKGVAIRATAV